MTGESHELLLGAHSMGVLDPDEAAAVEEHLARCVACREEVAELNAARDRLGAVPPEALLDELHDLPDEDTPEPGDLLLRHTLRRVRAERARRYRPKPLMAAAAVILAAVAVGGGVLIGRHGLAPAGPRPAVTLAANARTATGVNRAIGATMTASVVPAKGWVRVKVQMNGAPAGVGCRIMVVAKDGSVQQAGSWRTSAAGTAPVVDGAAAVTPADVDGVRVETLHGEPLVTARF